MYSRPCSQYLWRMVTFQLLIVFYSENSDFQTACTRSIQHPFSISLVWCTPDKISLIPSRRHREGATVNPGISSTLTFTPPPPLYPKENKPRYQLNRPIFNGRLHNDVSPKRFGTAKHAECQAANEARVKPLSRPASSMTTVGSAFVGCFLL